MVPVGQDLMAGAIHPLPVCIHMNEHTQTYIHKHACREQPHLYFCRQAFDTVIDENPYSSVLAVHSTGL